MSKTYTARLCGNKRDTKLSTPKALLIEIVDADGELFRDHCWVKISKLLEKVGNKIFQPFDGLHIQMIGWLIQSYICYFFFFSGKMKELLWRY